MGSTRGGFRAGDVGKLDRVITTGELMLDVKNFLVRVGGEPLELRLKEFELLAALAWHPWELRSRQELAVEIWGYAGATSSRTIDMHVRRLRAALAEKSSHDYVRTVRGFGYRFVPSNGPGNPGR